MVDVSKVSGAVIKFVEEVNMSDGNLAKLSESEKKKLSEYLANNKELKPEDKEFIEGYMIEHSAIEKENKEEELIDCQQTEIVEKNEGSIRFKESNKYAWPEIVLMFYSECLKNHSQKEIIAALRNANNIPKTLPFIPAGIVLPDKLFDGENEALRTEPKEIQRIKIVRGPSYYQIDNHEDKYKTKEEAKAAADAKQKIDE